MVAMRRRRRTLIPSSSCQLVGSRPSSRYKVQGTVHQRSGPDLLIAESLIYKVVLRNLHEVCITISAAGLIAQSKIDIV